MIQKLQRITTPPTDDDPERQRRLRAAWSVLLVGVPLAPILAALIALGGDPPQALIALLMSPICGLCLVLVKRGAVEAAAEVFVWALWFGIAIGVSVLGSGLEGPGLVFLFLVIVLAGYVGRGRTVAAVSVASLALATGLLWAKQAGILLVTPVNPVARWIVQMTGITLTAAVVAAGMRRTRITIARIQAARERNATLLKTVTSANERLRQATTRLKQQNDYLETLRRTSLALHMRLDAPDVLQTIVARAAQLFETPDGAICLADARGVLRVEAVAGFFSGQEGNEIQPGEGAVGKVFATGQPLIIDEYDAWPERLSAVPSGAIGSLALVPLRHGDAILGALAVARASTRKPFSAADTALLEQYAELAALALDNARLYAAARQELADRREAEAALRGFQTIVESAVEGMAIFNTESIHFANEALAHMLGYATAAALIGRGWRTLFAPEEGRRLAGVVARQLDTKGQWRGRAVGLRQDGTALTAELTVVRLDSGDLVAVVRDLTEQDLAAAALRRSEAAANALYATLPDLVLHLNRDGVYLAVHAGENFYMPVPASEMIGRRMKDVVAGDLAERSLATVRRALETRSLETFEYYTEVSQRYLEARVQAIGPDEVVCVIRDMTERRRAEAAMRQTQKLESLGLLAGGIAHDFNNLLTSMLAQASLAEAHLPAGAAARRHIERVIQSAEQAAELTRQLLAYAGKAQSAVIALDLNEVIKASSGLLETALPRQAQFELQLADALPPIHADRSQIQQVLMNLIINAVEALDQQPGRLTVRTELVQLAPASSGEQARFVGGRPPDPGRYVKLDVADTGCGISTSVLAQMFDPFFSTKADGRGLGLSSTLGILRTHGGAVQVESQLGRGTCFSVYFPAANGTADPPVPAVRSRGALAGTVLVIDDEPHVREAATDILALAGLTVLQAASGEVGLQLYAAQTQAISCVLLDMKMPGIDGIETLRRLQALNPQVRVVLSSGYSETDIEPFISGPTVHFLKKPYNIDDLLHMMGRVLSGSVPSA